MTVDEERDRTEVEVLTELWANRRDDPRATPAVLLARFADDDVLLAFARTGDPDDSTDALSETGALLAAVLADPAVSHVTMLVPARTIHLEHGAIGAQVVTTSICPPAPGVPLAITANITPWAHCDGQVRIGATARLVPEDSPVAMMMYRASLARSPGPMRATIEAARVLGFDVLHSGEDRLRTVSQKTADRTRQRMRRLAQELQRATAPSAPHEVAVRVRGGLAVDLPPGFVPASPF